MKKKIKMLEKIILDLGGSLPDEKMLKELGMKLNLEEAIKEKVKLQVAMAD